MASLSIGKAWDETRSVLERDGRLYVAIALAFFVLPTTIFGTLEPDALVGGQLLDERMQLFFLIVILLSLVGRLAMSWLALKTGAVGEAIRHALRRFLPAASAFILFVLPIVLLLAPFLPQVLQSPENPPPGPLLASTAIMLVAFVVGVRLALLLVPIAAAEAVGPLALLKRSWQLSRGNWWRLAAFLIVFFAANILAARALGYVLGGILILFAGPLKPMSVSALILSAALAIVGAAFTAIFSIMLARIYAQLATPAATVPEVRRES